mmetsp:Transcript_15605/g.27888  ORF Transcript_15605/g.27888 Transcript_15605/m.27888 type:complete len:211 (+) Transcript_15605:246-878(+)
MTKLVTCATWFLTTLQFSSAVNLSATRAKSGRSSGTDFQQSVISNLYCLTGTSAGTGSSSSGGMIGRMSGLMDSLHMTISSSCHWSNGCLNVSNSYIMIPKLYTSVHLDSLLSMYDSGACHLGFVSFAVFSSAPKILANPKSPNFKCWSLVTKTFGDRKSPWMYLRLCKNAIPAAMSCSIWRRVPQFSKVWSTSMPWRRSSNSWYNDPLG